LIAEKKNSFPRGPRKRRTSGSHFQDVLTTDERRKGPVMLTEYDEEQQKGGEEKKEIN